MIASIDMREREIGEQERGNIKGGQLPETVGLKNPTRGSFSFVRSGLRERGRLKTRSAYAAPSLHFGL